MAKNIPVSDNIDTIELLDADRAKSIVDSKNEDGDAVAKHASDEGAAFVLVFFLGNWYKCAPGDLDAIAKIAESDKRGTHEEEFADDASREAAEKNAADAKGKGKR